MIGPAIALISAIAFAFDAIFSRRAVLNISNASLGTLITVPMSIPPLLLILAINGQLPSIKSFSWASYFRYVALSPAPASVVATLVSTTPVFLLLFSYLINRNLDIFSKPIIFETLMVVIGSLLLV